MMKTAIGILVIILSLNGARGQVLPREFVENKSIPSWVKREFVARGLDHEYAITFQMSPSYIKGDFNGDGRKDYAFLIQEIRTKKFGIA